MIVIFDDDKTTLDIIINELKKGNFTVKGQPIEFKQCGCAIAEQGKQCVIGKTLTAAKTESECYLKGGAWIKIEKVMVRLPAVPPNKSKVILQDDTIENNKSMPSNEFFTNDTIYR